MAKTYVVTKTVGGTARVSEEELTAAAEKLKDCLIKVECTHYSSYDNSDDDRVTDSESRYDYTVYGEITPFEDSEAMLWAGGAIVGVVFRIKASRGNGVSLHRFTFDGRVQESISMGYSASHSENYTYVNSLSLVRKGEDGAPENGRSLRYEQHEMYPSF